MRHKNAFLYDFIFWAILLFDFRADSREIKDTSAAAIAASGMIELSQFAKEGERYKDHAVKILEELSEKYSNFENEHESMLTRATANKSGDENVEVGLIYADYYYVEAVRKLVKNTTDLPWEQ